MSQSSAAFSRRAFAAAFTLVVALGLAACSSESTERKAFISFLQTRIIDKPGVRVPTLTPSETKSFGDYSSHFAVIRNFNDAMDKTVSGPMQKMMSKGMPQSLPDLMARRADIATFRQQATLLREGITREVAKADAERAALKQPDDLKVVYDKAYAKTVTEPAEVFGELLPEAEATFDSADKLAAFLDKNSANIKLNGSLIEISDPKLHAEVNAMMKEMAAHSANINAAGRKLQAMMMGR